jgi:hypothetical protein
MEATLKQFLDAVGNGELRRDLFLFPKTVHRELFKLELVDQANARGLVGLVNMTPSTVVFLRDKGPAGSTAFLRVAHPRLDLECKGQEFTAVHGLDCYGETDDGARISAALRAQVRS